MTMYLIPFSLGVVLMFTQPIWAAIFTFIFNGEKLKTLQWVSIFFAMFGVVIMTNPQLVFFWTEGERGFDMAEWPYFGLGVLTALGFAIQSGIAYLFMRKVGTAVNPTAGNFHFGVVSMFLVLGIYLYERTPFMQVDLYSLSLIVGIIITGFSTQWGINWAIALGRAGPLSSINYLQIVMACVFDVTIFGQSLVWTDILGTFCIIGCALLGYVIEAL